MTRSPVTPSGRRRAFATLLIGLLLSTLSGLAPAEVPRGEALTAAATSAAGDGRESNDSQGAEPRASEVPQSAPEDARAALRRRFDADLAALLRTPHRLAGSPAGKAAAGHIEERLRALGVEVHALEFPVWQQVTRHCELVVKGRRVNAHPLRPNVVVPPVTPPGGISSRFVYAERGELSDYGQRSPQGAIVALDYDSGRAWERAFALGAVGVVFLGFGSETPVEPKFAGVPSNQVRVYVDARSAPLDLRRDHEDARLDCRVGWQKATARNLVARVAGTDPRGGAAMPRPEALLLSADYDSFGVVPELAPGARGAANVAALLAAVERFQAAPPTRDVLFAFLDAGARGHQGARELYAVLTSSHGAVAERFESVRAEHLHVGAMLQLLDAHGLDFPRDVALEAASVEVPGRLDDELERQADHARDDVRKELVVRRLGAQRAGATDPEVEALEALALRWDEVRRALHAGELPRLVASEGNSAAFRALFTELRTRTKGRLQRRALELEAASRRLEQERELRRAFGFDRGDESTFLALHVSYDLSDRGARFGVVVGDWSQRSFGFRAPKTEGDNPGYYGRILGAFREVGRPESALDWQTLSDPSHGLTFASGPFVEAGSVAGAYGIYNVALMTGYDRRPRDGHPADGLASLNVGHFFELSAQATELVLALASNEALSTPRVFRDQARNKWPGWKGGLSTGDYAGLTVSGSLAENRPAAGALVALWPGEDTWVRQAWSTLADADVFPGFDPLSYEIVDENGRFRVCSFREDMHDEVMALGALFDDDGRVLAISTTEHQVQKLNDAMRVNLIHANGGQWSSLRSHQGQPGLMRLLNAATDSPFRDGRALWGRLGNHGFFYLSDQIVDQQVKLFEPFGEAVLGAFGPRHPYGSGVTPDFFAGATALSAATSEQLWQLDEGRLGQLRARGVTSADLETLHGRAQRARERALEQTSVMERQAALMTSSALSQRVYLPLRQNMDDLVHAIVILLLLAIPFAFALERLLFCATTVYGRIAGFTATFLATFGLIYWMHPGFAIASTPMIVFLAFAIVLLSALVIAIVLRKFKSELRAVQGQGQGAHQLEVSRMGTLLAAIGMGVSTMRRRPTRTSLTAVTVVMLTFTILSFASFSQTVGVKSVYEGPSVQGVEADLLLRKLDYSALPEGLLDMLATSEGQSGLLAPQYWVVREKEGDPRVTVAHPGSGKVVLLDAVMGIDPRELQRWPALAAALGPGTAAEKAARLERGGVFLPKIVSELVGAAPSEAVLLGGRELRFEGTLDGPTLQRLQNLDGQSVLPVDFRDASSLSAAETSSAPADENQLLLAEEVDREFVHSSSDQVAIASKETALALGGRLHSLNIYTDDGVDVAERGRRLSELVVMPVWALGRDGVERLLFTVLTGVSGGFALFVPLLLGGLIIFGTLLGSISDREREIYTFSALGLSPGHVGVLFFAEAAVYAVVGGMGGQLLAQAVGLGASELSSRGLLPPLSLNYSSTNSLFAIAVVMVTVLVSAIHPALRASKSANPGLVRSWKLPAPEGDRLELRFPFTVSAYDVTGVVSFLAAHFERHDDAGLGGFAASGTAIGRTSARRLELRAQLALAPFDLGVTQSFGLVAVPSEIDGVDEIAISLVRLSGAESDWVRANRTFLEGLRRQFLIWRTLSSEVIESYRMRTLTLLGDERRREDQQ